VKLERLNVKMKNNVLLWVPMVFLFLVGSYLFLGTVIDFDVVDAPKITGFKYSNSTKEGLYKTGDSIKILVSFSDPVLVDIREDRPSIPLRVGIVERPAFYTGGSKTKNLIFEYVVSPGDSSIDLSLRCRYFYYSCLRLNYHHKSWSIFRSLWNYVIVARPGSIRGLKNSVSANLVLPDELINPLLGYKRILIDSSSPIHWKFNKIAGYKENCYAPCLPQQIESALLAEQVFAVDLDEDGDIDALSANYATRDITGIQWHENNGDKSFVSHSITVKLFRARTVYATDVDNDDDIDIIAGGREELVWFENDGNENFISHLIKKTKHEVEFTQVVSEDLDLDGDKDIVVTSQWDNSIAWYENNGSQEFTSHYISTSSEGAHDVKVVDVDLDHDLDIVSVSWVDSTVAWHENNGSQEFTKHIISDSATFVNSVHAVDLDKDGDIDVLSDSAALDAVIWYENNGSQEFTPHYITTNADRVYDVYPIDIDADGDMDVLSASSLDHTIAWYENDGEQNFKPHLITNQALGVSSIFAADIDNDGDIDVFSTTALDSSVHWYENY
jgi:uncharacterized protein (DUF952 family)